MTFKEFKELVDTALEQKEGCVWQTLDKSLGLCLVLGWVPKEEGEQALYTEEDGGVDYTLHAKIAVNEDDLQCDYDLDWAMPDLNDGDILDTDAPLSDLQGDYDYYESAAEEIISLMKEALD